MPEQLFGAIPSLRKQLAARNSVWLSFHQPSMRTNAAVKSVYHGREGSATMLLCGSSPPCEGKAGTAHEQLGRGSLTAWDLELGVIRTAMTAAGRVGLRLFGIPGQSGGRSNRSFMRWHAMMPIAVVIVVVEVEVEVEILERRVVHSVTPGLLESSPSSTAQNGRQNTIEEL